MKRISTLWFIFALAATYAALAQTAPPVAYGSTTFVKCKPGKGQACEDFLKKNLHVAMQARQAKGMISLFTLSRVVIPNASEAGFTHAYSITSAKPAPAEPSAEYTKVGDDARGIPIAEYYRQGDELMDFVSQVRYVQLATTGGSPQVGNFARMTFLKTPPGKQAELTELMRTKEKPLEAQFQKDGAITAWVFRGIQYRGSEDPYNAIEIIGFKDAEAATAGGGLAQAQAAFAKALPGMSWATYNDQRTALRRVVKVRTVKLIDVVGSLN